MAIRHLIILRYIATLSRFSNFYFHGRQKGRIRARSSTAIKGDLTRNLLQLSCSIQIHDLCSDEIELNLDVDR